MRPKIGIDGLAQFNRSLRQVGPEAPKKLRLALNSVSDLLVTRTVPTIPTRTGAARRSMKARSTRTSARVAVGGRLAPYFPWLDFGGRTGRNRSVERPFYKDGRYVFPTLKKITPEVQDKLRDSLDDVARAAGLDVE